MNKNRKIEGTGLGLPITKKLVTLMHGDIKVESEYGKGTRFTIFVKQKVMDSRTVKEMPMTRRSVEEKNEQMFLCKDYRVLVVDDNIINRKVATAMLSSYAFQIHEANSGKSAIELVRKNEYDMIFMDHMMPEMDGVEATRVIRSECGETAKKAIIIALTANAIQGAKEMYLENGFEDFLSKPFERIQMHELLCKWIPEEMREYQEKRVARDKVSEDEMAEIFMAGINVRNAIKKNDFTMEEYLTLLDRFCKDSDVQKSLLCKYVKEKDYESYLAELRSLRNTVKKIGAENLLKEVEELADAIEHQDYDFVEQRYAQCIVDYERIVSEMERVLKKKQWKRG